MKLLISILSLTCSMAVAQVADQEIGLNQYRKALHIGLGYLSGTGTEDFTIVQQRSTHTTYTFKNGSWGKGIYLKVGYSYKIHPNLGLGIDGGMFVGLKLKQENEYYDAGTVSYQTLSYRAINFRMMPYAQFDVPVNKNAAIYAKLGYVLGFGKMRYSGEDRYYGLGSVESYEYERTGGALNGTSMALGYRFKVGRDISFFMEMNVNSLKQKVKQDQMVKAEVDGVNVLHYVRKYYTTIEYVDELVVPAYAPNPNYDEPQKQLTYQTIHSSVGLQLGINLYLAR